MSTLEDRVDIVIGVDTHCAAIVALTGAAMQLVTVPATKKGRGSLVVRRAEGGRSGNGMSERSPTSRRSHCHSSTRRGHRRASEQRRA